MNIARFAFRLLAAVLGLTELLVLATSALGLALLMRCSNRTLLALCVAFAAFIVLASRSCYLSWQRFSPSALHVHNAATGLVSSAISVVLVPSLTGWFLCLWFRHFRWTGSYPVFSNLLPLTLVGLVVAVSMVRLLRGGSWVLLLMPGASARLEESRGLR